MKQPYTCLILLASCSHTDYNCFTGGQAAAGTKKQEKGETEWKKSQALPLTI